MTLDEIKAAVDAGHTVHWSNESYVVIKDRTDQWIIKCTTNDSCIGLTWSDGVTLNGREDQFYKSLRHRPKHTPIPKTWPVQPVRPFHRTADCCTCGHCGLSWDDSKSTSMTPTPSGRCPFEQFHVYH